MGLRWAHAQPFSLRLSPTIEQLWVPLLGVKLALWSRLHPVLLGVEFFLPAKEVGIDQLLGDQIAEEDRASPPLQILPGSKSSLTFPLPVSHPVEQSSLLGPLSNPQLLHTAIESYRERRGKVSSTSISPETQTHLMRQGGAWNGDGVAFGK